MFKLILSISIAGLCLLVSCKKDDVLQQPENQSSFIRKSFPVGDSIEQINCANYSFLKFRDKDAFINTLRRLGDSTITNDSALDDFHSNFTFNNLRGGIELLSTDSLKNLAYRKFSKLMATVLSQDTIIQIDSLAFLIDFDDSSIYEMYPVTCNNLTLLKQKQEVNVDSMYIFKYHINEPVFHPSGYTEWSGKWFRWVKKVFSGCDHIWAGAAFQESQPPYFSTIGGAYRKLRVTIRHEYYRLGLYFDIKHEYVHEIEEVNIFGTAKWKLYNAQVAFSHQDNWRVFCGGTGQNANWPNSTYGWNSNFRFFTYQSSNSLARNQNTVKSYLYLIPSGTGASIANPYYLGIPNLNF